MTLKVISPEAIAFEGQVTSVTLPGEMGSFTVLKNHASLISVLTAGNLRYVQENGEEGEVPVKGGIADIDNNVISVCVY